MDDLPPSDDEEEQFRAVDDETVSHLDAISSQLFTATESMQSVTTMSEPVRADAIAIARDILRLLKVTFGEVTTLTGLNLKSREEGLALGSLAAVGTIYSQLLAWARGIDGSIMSDPSVLAAIDAFGVIGYMAKREALRIARTSKDMFLATSIAQQLDNISGKYLNSPEQNVGKLLERIEHGIDRVLSRVQDLTKAGAGVSQSKNELGGGMSGTPTAGQAMQQSSNATRDAASKRLADAKIADELAAQAEAARAAAQNAARAKREGKAPPPRPAPGSSAARQTAQQARTQQTQRSQTATTTAIPAAATAAQMQNRINNARMANIHNEQSHNEEDHHQQEQQAIQRQLAAAREAAARKAAQKATATAAAAQKQQAKPAINADMLKGFKGFDMSGMKPVPESVKPQVSSQAANPSNGLKPPPTPPVAPVIDPITNQPIPGKGIGR